MKVSDLIYQLAGMPQDADVEIDLGEEFHGFTVEHATKGDSSPHLVVLNPLPDPPHIAEMHTKYERLADAEPALSEALQLTSGALQCVAQLLPMGEIHPIKFTGKWSHLPSQNISQILDRANAALEPKAEA